jgi:hypothetical protein
VEIDGDGLRLSQTMLSDSVAAIAKLPIQVKDAVRLTVTRYKSIELDDLLRSVYSTYPQFAFNSTRPELVLSETRKPATAPLAIYTMGYEGKSIDNFLHTIIKAGIGTILDVRANPISRKYGFARSSMSTLASNMGIRYVHIPELGIPSGKRKNLDSFDSYAKLFCDYEETMLPNQPEAFRRATELVKEQPTVLVCMEKHPDSCHRSRLAKALKCATGLSIVHR